MPSGCHARTHCATWSAAGAPGADSRCSTPSTSDADAFSASRWRGRASGSAVSSSTCAAGGSAAYCAARQTATGLAPGCGDDSHSRHARCATARQSCRAAAPPRTAPIAPSTSGRTPPRSRRGRSRRPTAHAGAAPTPRTARARRAPTRGAPQPPPSTRASAGRRAARRSPRRCACGRCAGVRRRRRPTGACRTWRAARTFAVGANLRAPTRICGDARSASSAHVGRAKLAVAVAATKREVGSSSRRRCSRSP